MKKKNNKGFTMVEILAVIVILGILAGVAVPLVYRYVDRSKKQSYETMEESIYDAARNYVMEENKFLATCNAAGTSYSNIETADNMLVDFQYVENLVDPSDKSKRCSYNVYGCMVDDGAGETLASYKYKVELECINYSHCGIYTDDGKMTNCS